VSPEFKRRCSVFFKAKRSLVSLSLLGILLITSVSAEWITNSKPLVAVYKGSVFFPAYKDYNLEVFGQVGAGIVDYRELRSEFSYSLWPLLNWDPIEADDALDHYMTPPEKKHIMGTDISGRDVFARLLYGTRISFLFALATWFLNYTIGTILGMVQGFFGGWFDLIGQRTVEVFSSIPEFYLLLLLITMLNPNIILLIIVSAIFGWVSISQYMRAEALRNRNLTFAEAARALGASRTRILCKHILPNSLVPIVTFSPFAIVSGITGLAALDLLGFGVPAPTPSWGELLDQARANYQIAWWLAAFPSLFLFLSVVCLNLIGDSLRKAFDPRG
jgi:microcin C transport system permease protein